MSSEIIACLGCGYRNLWKGEINFKCLKCGEVISKVKTQLDDDSVWKRIDIAAGYRRVGRFDDSQQELENLLAIYKDEDLPQALFASFLNSYEVTEYAFDEDNSVRLCKCNSTSRRPVDNNLDWQDAKKYIQGEQLAQWMALSQKIEAIRLDNLRIKNNLPRYRAVLICDYANEEDMIAARSIYDILSTKTDVFYPPITLENVVESEEKEKYLIQILKNPEIAPLMFVIYSNAFNYRNKAKNFFSNAAGQCREFAKVHTKAELFSVTYDYEASPMMKTISIKTIRCKEFSSKTYNNIANKILDNILISAYSDEEYEIFRDGEIIKLNEDKGLSPKVCPLGEK